MEQDDLSDSLEKVNIDQDQDDLSDLLGKTKLFTNPTETEKYENLNILEMNMNMITNITQNISYKDMCQIYDRIYGYNILYINVLEDESGGVQSDQGREVLEYLTPWRQYIPHSDLTAQLFFQFIEYTMYAYSVILEAVKN